MTLGGSRRRSLAVGVCLLWAAIAGCGGEPPRAAEVPAAAGGTGTMVEVGCAEGGPSPQRMRRGDLPFGPFVLMGVDEGDLRPGHRRAGIERPPDAFGGHGYKVPISLPNGTSAVLSVPRFERGRLGLVFTQQSQRRVLRDGSPALTARSASPPAPEVEHRVAPAGRAGSSSTTLTAPR